LACVTTNIPEFAKPVSQSPSQVDLTSAPAPVVEKRGSDDRRPRHLKRRLRAQQEILNPETEGAPSRVGPVNAGASDPSQRPAVVPAYLAGAAPAPVSKPGKSEIAAAESQWPLTLARLRAVVPGIDALFLLRLLQIVNTRFSGVTDVELAAAAEQAWRARSGYQKGAGLFLDTIPEAMAALRARGEARAGPGTNSPFGSGTPMKEVKPEVDFDVWMETVRKSREPKN
jgi:hypothetical protein